MEISRFTAIRFLENLQNGTFKDFYLVDEKKMEEEVSTDFPTPKPLSNEDKLI